MFSNIMHCKDKVFNNAVTICHAKSFFISGIRMKFFHFRYTYEIAPVYIMMEKYVIEKMLSYAEFQNGDGMFFAGIKLIFKNVIT